MDALTTQRWQRQWPTSTYAGRAIYPPGGVYGPLMQQHVQLVALHSGSLSMYVDGERRDYEPGWLIWLIPGTRLFFEFSKTEESWHSWVDYHGNPPADLMQRLTEGPIALPSSQEIDRILADAVAWQISGRQTRTELVRSAAWQLMLIYLDEAALHDLDGLATHPMVYQVMRFATRRLSQPLSLKDLAAHASVTPEHLCRLFARAGYPSPMAWLWSVRLRQSLGILRSTQLTVEEVARQCGFRSPFHFSRKVKEYTGLSPTEYRRQKFTLEDVGGDT